MSQSRSTLRSGLDPDHDIREYEATDPIPRGEFSKRARQTVENHINTGENDRLEIEWLHDGRVKLHATSYVGLLSLPGGPTVQIRPKVEGTDLLSVLQYSEGIKAETIREEVSFSRGNEFIRALATLFESELATVIQRGLSKEYRRHSDTEDHVRGRIAVQRQLARHGPQPTKFECTYDTLTQDTVLNQGVLYATDVLLRLVDDTRLGQSLQRHKQVLQRAVELRPVRPVELEQIELSRLATHYEDLYRLTLLVLRGVYVDDLRSGDRDSFSLLVNMNTIFEKVIERALEEVFADCSVDIDPQATSKDLLWNKQESVPIRPDILASGGDETLFVGDAKWKQDTEDSSEPSNSDLYQLLSYQVAHEAPGILFYPVQGGRVSTSFESNYDHDQHLIEVPVSSSDDEEEYSETVQSALNTELNDRLGIEL